MIYKTFDDARADFKPYGLTCESWIPTRMPRVDRHNEIEINYINSGKISYFFKDSIIEVPQKRISIFWGLVPHRIMDYENEESYYVCTIPLAVFLKWGLPENMVNHVLSGHVLIDNSDIPNSYDDFYFHVGIGTYPPIPTIGQAFRRYRRASCGLEIITQWWRMPATCKCQLQRK